MRRAGGLFLQFLPEAPAALPILRLAELPEAPAESLEDAPAASGTAAQVLEMIGATPIPVDELGRRCQLSAAALSTILLDLEMAGRIETLPGNRVALA